MATRRDARKQLEHLLVSRTARTSEYHPAGGGEPLPLPPRQRGEHANKLLGQLRDIKIKGAELKKFRESVSSDLDGGLTLKFESTRDFDLKFESLDLRSQGIELLSVTKEGGIHSAICFVPEGKLGFFVDRIKAYKTETTQAGKPKHQPLIASIESIQLAAVGQLWTDDLDELPAAQSEFHWEVWLRNDENAVQQFDLAAASCNIKVLDEQIKFPERLVKCVSCTRSVMGKVVKLCSSVAELRAAPKLRREQRTLRHIDNNTLSQSFAENLSMDGDATGVVCILDTGVNNSHPLLAPALDDQNCHSYKDSWATDDNDGHGTEMAGIALYGDLASAIEGNESSLTHALESVKIFEAKDPNPPWLYGAVTREGVTKAETENPDVNRVISMAVTAETSVDGEPSTWSAAIDSLISGYGGEQPRLMLISAGNCDGDMSDHPTCCQESSIQDPGQAWNALTIGAYTELDSIPSAKYADYSVVAPAGDVSPYSTTSTLWDSRWPIKPEIVFEGGNCAVDPLDGSALQIDELSLLTTNYRPTRKLFSLTWATSAATAFGANFAARLHAKYPNYWPETIRGLMVHSADWTEQMRSHFQPLNNRELHAKLLRYCGYGVPDFESACWSATNALTLVAQDQFQPYSKVGGAIRTTALNLHTLPWPKAALEALGDVEVELRVTLSYYVEPSPGRRGWRGRYRYSSHALRFDVKTDAESASDFIRRMRSNDPDADDNTVAGSASDSAAWRLGPVVRHRGSIHSDRWTGRASALARRNMVAVFPVVGWWRERSHLAAWDRVARYSLIISLRSPKIEVDIYTPVQIAIGNLVGIDAED